MSALWYGAPIEPVRGEFWLLRAADLEGAQRRSPWYAEIYAPQEAQAYRNALPIDPLWLRLARLAAL